MPTHNAQNVAYSFAPYHLRSVRLLLLEMKENRGSPRIVCVAEGSEILGSFRMGKPLPQLVWSTCSYCSTPLSPAPPPQCWSVLYCLTQCNSPHRGQSLICIVSRKWRPVRTTSIAKVHVPLKLCPPLRDAQVSPTKAEILVSVYYEIETSKQMFFSTQTHASVCRARSPPHGNIPRYPVKKALHLYCPHEWTGKFRMMEGVGLSVPRRCLASA